jgi:hypothetical protein
MNSISTAKVSGKGAEELAAYVDLVDGELMSSRGLPRKFRRLDSAGDMVRVFASSRKGGTMHLKSNVMNAAILDLVSD